MRSICERKTSSGEAEKSFAFEFEQPAFLTLGICYEERPRLSGGAYQSILRRVDAFLDEPMARAIKERERRGKKILKLDDAVSAVVLLIGVVTSVFTAVYFTRMLVALWIRRARPRALHI